MSSFNAIFQTALKCSTQEYSHAVSILTSLIQDGQGAASPQERDNLRAALTLVHIRAGDMAAADACCPASSGPTRVAERLATGQWSEATAIALKSSTQGHVDEGLATNNLAVARFFEGQLTEVRHVQ